MNHMNHDNGEMQLDSNRRAHLTNVQRQVVFEDLNAGRMAEKMNLIQVSHNGLSKS